MFEAGTAPIGVAAARSPLLCAYLYFMATSSCEYYGTVGCTGFFTMLTFKEELDYYRVMLDFKLTLAFVLFMVSWYYFFGFIILLIDIVLIYPSEFWPL